MIVALVYLLMTTNAIASIWYPWIGVVASYLTVLLTPFAIWWWAFGDIRPMYFILLPTFLGFMLALFRRKIDFSILNTKINWCVGLLFVWYTISYYFGPYVHVVNAYRFYDPPTMFSALQKTYLTYFVAVLLIDNTKKLRWLILAAIIAVIYLTYWANTEYLFNHRYGRMSGPVPLGGYSIYHDENVFATLFVMGFPFVFFLGRYVKSKLFAWAIWLTIPLTWHAVFLTASRGALLGIVAVLGVFALRLKYKSVGIAVMLAFFAAFAWQAGDVMKSRSATIADYENEDSASLRIDAWGAATKMMLDHPFTGVGFSSFGQAFPKYSEKAPRIAHNTFFQIAGEWGFFAIVTYLVLILSTLNSLRKNGNRLKNQLLTDEQRLAYYLNESSLYALVGFVTCSSFLSLEKYDMLYYLLVVANSTLVCTGYWKEKRAATERAKYGRSRDYARANT